MEKCQVCQFYDRQNAKPSDGQVTQWGQCRRASPRLHPINAKSYMIEGVWPHVRDDDWCGEWKLAARRAESRITEVSTGPLVPAQNPASPMPLPQPLTPPMPPRTAPIHRPANIGASLSLMPLPGGVMAAIGRGD